MLIRCLPVLLRLLHSPLPAVLPVSNTCCDACSDTLQYCACECVCLQATMVATWLTELLLDTLNRALLQQGAGADEAASSSGGDGANGAAAADGDDGSGTSYRQVSLRCPICSPHASPACCRCCQHHLMQTCPSAASPCLPVLAPVPHAHPPALPAPACRPAHN